MATYRVTSIEPEGAVLTQLHSGGKVGEYTPQWWQHTYSDYVRATNCNPQVGDLIDTDIDGILGLSLEGLDNADRT